MTVVGDLPEFIVLLIEEYQKRYNPNRQFYSRSPFFRTGSRFIAQSMPFLTDESENILRREASTKTISRYEDPFIYAHIIDISNSVLNIIQLHPNFKRDRKLAIATIDSGRINGSSSYIVEDNYDIIFIDTGVMPFANLMAKAFAQSIPHKMFHDHVCYDFNMESNYRFSKESTTSNRVMDVVLSYLLLGDPRHSESYFPKKSYHYLMAQWRDAIEYFLMSHEYGHVISNHTRGVSNGAAEIYIVDNNIPELWRHELEADSFSLTACLRTQENKGVPYHISYSGIEIFFSGIELIERSKSKINKFVFNDVGTSTHPPIEMRRANLMGMLECNLEKWQVDEAKVATRMVRKIAESCWEKLEDSINIIGNSTYLHEKWNR